MTSSPLGVTRCKFIEAAISWFIWLPLNLFWHKEWTQQTFLDKTNTWVQPLKDFCSQIAIETLAKGCRDMFDCLFFFLSFCFSCFLAHYIVPISIMYWLCLYSFSCQRLPFSCTAIGVTSCYLFKPPSFSMTE